jgi:hypothetical protein
MEVSGKLHASAALLSQKESRGPTAGLNALDKQSFLLLLLGFCGLDTRQLKRYVIR